MIMPTFVSVRKNSSSSSIANNGAGILPFRTPTSMIGRGSTCPSKQGATHLPSAMASRSADRKSTRLNSSHGYISYAVFCLKKKKYIQTPSRQTHPSFVETSPDDPKPFRLRLTIADIRVLLHLSSTSSKSRVYCSLPNALHY